MTSVSVYRALVFVGFSDHGISIHNIILLLKEKKKKNFNCFEKYSEYATENC